MAYTPSNPNGKTNSANSAPVVLSSEQSPSLIAQDDSIVLLSRILKTLESLTIVDTAQRQRITIDAIGGGLSLQAINSIAGMDREMYINQARIAYNTGIRSKIN
jgi:hypothetical protein